MFPARYFNSNYFTLKYWPKVDLNTLTIKQIQIPVGLNVPTSPTISMYRGEDVLIAATLSPANNISAWNFAFTVRSALGSPTNLIYKTTPSQIVVASSSLAIFWIRLVSADTAGMNVQSYTYDIQRTDVGARTLLAEGTFTLLQMVNQVAP